MKKWWLILIGLGLVLLTLKPDLVKAHGEPVLAVNPVTVPAGGEVTVTGTEMEDGESFVITLEGLSSSFPLGEVVVAEEGFEIKLQIPADVPPGSYRVQAAAGEETAVTDLTITPAAEKDDGDEHAEGQPEPSAEPMDLERPGSSARTLSLAAIALAFLGLGIWMVRRS